MPMFFNFHTHKKDEKFGIINLFPDETNILDESKLYSCGIHPWHYDKNSSAQIEIIEELAKKKKIVAIGETGFDSKSKLNISEQISIFNKHIEISEQYKLPIIVHCVKFHNELIRLKKRLNPSQAWILHGFNSKLSIAKDLIETGLYISLANNILENNEKIDLLLKNTPLNKIFLETDDHNISINDIYILASTRLNINIDELNAQILKNIENIGIRI